MAGNGEGGGDRGKGDDLVGAFHGIGGEAVDREIKHTTGFAVIRGAQPVAPHAQAGDGQKDAAEASLKTEFEGIRQRVLGQIDPNISAIRIRGEDATVFGDNNVGVLGEELAEVGIELDTGDDSKEITADDLLEIATKRLKRQLLVAMRDQKVASTQQVKGPIVVQMRAGDRHETVSIGQTKQTVSIEDMLALMVKNETGGNAWLELQGKHLDDGTTCEDFFGPPDKSSKRTVFEAALVAALGKVDTELPTGLNNLFSTPVSLRRQKLLGLLESSKSTLEEFLRDIGTIAKQGVFDAFYIIFDHGELSLITRGNVPKAYLNLDRGNRKAMEKGYAEGEVQIYKIPAGAFDQSVNLFARRI